jgi:transcriptional regulator with XRE-family HTH domain
MERLPSERFGAVVRQLRKSRGWSQERLAADAGVNRSYMGEIERARAVPTLATAEKLAQALDVPLSTLIVRCELPPVASRAAAWPGAASAQADHVENVG